MTREDAIQELQNCKGLIQQDGQDYLDERDIPFLDMAIEALSAEAVQGEWKFVGNEMFAGEYFCSICGKRAEVDLYGEWILSNYCPQCGARMKGGAE